MTDAAQDGDTLARVLPWSLGVTTRAENMPPRAPTSDARPAEFIVLVELAEVCGKLERLRRDSASANAELRQRRSRLIRLDALLRADSIALATLRERDTADRVAVEILDDAIAGARRARTAANDSAAQAADSLAPVLERLSQAITRLERQAEALRARLSGSTIELLDALARRNISPAVAALENNACGACHVRLPQRSRTR